ncbi:hypothetical protein Pelo_7475 [Pelomyxa schiedti]|nr:hypothetical protein Pelo_7443 [Pelomyxa schiedti]KAH3760730.1 hypothetical protein Pelo_7475 [Pelomyxa schiedti]
MATQMYGDVAAITGEARFECADAVTVRIAAGEGRWLNIISATYGGANPNRDVTEAIRNLVVDESWIHVEGGIHTRIGDPEPGVPKRLVINYKFLPIESEMKVFRCHDGETVDITPPENYILHILHATYGGGFPKRQVTSKVAALVTGTGIHVTGGIHTRIGDPEPGVPKTLVIFYKFVVSRKKFLFFGCADAEPVCIVAPSGYTLNVVESTYGGDEPNRDVTASVRALVHNSTEIRAEHGGIHLLIGDPEFGVPKTFNVTYKFLPDGRSHEEMEFHCVDGEPVHIHAPQGKGLQITNATYGGNNPSHDVTDLVYAIVQHNDSIDVDGGIHTQIGDPEPGVPKKFVLHYKFVALPLEAAFTCGDFEPVHIAAPHGYSLQIARATYGGHNPQRDVTDKVSALVSSGAINVDGGIHTQIGDPEPGVGKRLEILYAFVHL